MMSMNAQLTYTLDNNNTRLVRGPTGFPERQFDKAAVTSQLAFAVIFQSRF